MIDNDPPPEPSGTRKSCQRDGGEQEMEIAGKYVADFQRGEKALHLFPFAGEEHEVYVCEKHEGDGEKQQGGCEHETPVKPLRDAGFPVMPSVFVQVGQQERGDDERNDQEPGMARERVRPIPLHGVDEVDAEQRTDAHDDGEALVDCDGFCQFQG